jgi:phosphoglycolate phosphatase
MTGVAFDLDGCIIDSRASILASVHVAMASLGLPPQDDEALLWLIGPPLDVGFAELLRRMDRDVDDAPELLRRYRADYADTMVERTTVMPGMDDAVRKVAESRAVAVVTSKPREFAVQLLEHVGLLDVLAVVEGPPLRASNEPKADTLARALTTVALDTMVGDRHHDIDAGKTHGLRTIGVTWGIGDAAELGEAGADVIVDTPDELVDVLS